MWGNLSGYLSWQVISGLIENNDGFHLKLGIACCLQVGGCLIPKLIDHLIDDLLLHYICLVNAGYI